MNSGRIYRLLWRLFWLAGMTAVMTVMAGCASTNEYQNMLNTWHGVNAQKLVSAWGYPNASVMLPNKNIAYLYNDYDWHRIVTSTSDANPMGELVKSYCHTWFEVNPRNIIVNTEFRGNDCVPNKTYGWMVNY